MRPQTTVEPSSPTTTRDRREEVREDLLLRAATPNVVVLCAEAFRAELVNQSRGGIGIRVTRAESDLQVGNTLDVIYHGERRSGQIRHVTQTDEGTVIGLQWLGNDE